MAAPITGPILTENYNNVHGTGSFWEWKEAYRQKKPFTDVLPYTHWKRVCLEDVYSNAGAQANAHAGHSPWYLYASPKAKGDPDVDWCVNKARLNFIDKVNNGGVNLPPGEYPDGTSAALANSFAERRQAANMIVGRARQLRQTISALRRGRVGDAITTLAHGDDATVQRLKKASRSRTFDGKTNAKSVANQWLELHFGWVPLFGDISDAAKVFSKPIPLGKIQAAATHRQVNVGEANFWPEWRNYGSQLVKVKVRVGASVRVTNPDLYLYQRLGLINPLSVAWEVTPWSFVFDWITNFGEYLNALTDTLGITFEGAWHTTKTQVDGRYWHQAGYGGPRTEIVTTCETFRRYVGFPELTLMTRPYKDPSVTRAATAIALLVQMLPGRETPTSTRQNRITKWKGTLT